MLNRQIILTKLKNGASALNRYLDSRISLHWFAHPIIRWSLAVIIVIYIGVGVLVGWKVYKVKAESTNIRRVLIGYPYPAVLMPQDVILVRDYLNQLKYIRHFADKTKKPLPPDNDLRSQLVNQMIETRLLLNASRRYNVRVTKADIDATFKKIADDNGGPEEIGKLLTDLYGMTEREFRGLIRDQLLREKFKQDVLAQVQAKHILIRDEKKAKDILEQIKKEPAKFDELAKQYSEDTATRDKAGDLGFLPRGAMVQAFEEAAFKLKKDEMTQELVKTEFGWHIIKVIDRRGKIEQSYKDFITDLRANKLIWIVLK